MTTSTPGSGTGSGRRRPRRPWVAGACLALGWLALAGCEGSPPGERREAERPSEAATDPVLPEGPSPGFVVWESNRSGEWRLWRADLDGGGVRQLTTAEGRERHCCAHVAPDGRSIAYLALPAGRQRYYDERALGQLRLLAADGSSSRPLAEGARTYFEHRAAVWVDERTLHYIGRDGEVRRLSLDAGDEGIVLRPTGDPSVRWLVDPTARWAASGRALLASVTDGRLGGRIPLPGCQPYFAAGGASAFWTAGAGGPIDRYDLETGEATTILRKNDSRLPPGRGYLYFPMLSRDGTLLAFAASDGAHDHFRADYDVFVAEVDEASMELLADPWQVAAHPAVDRFPDVWRASLELGRTVGVAPLQVELEAPRTPGSTATEASWTWSFDGRESGGPRWSETLSRPGSFTIQARLDGRFAHGVLVARAPETPPALEAEWPARRDGLLWSWSSAVDAATTPLEGRGRCATRDEGVARRPLELAGCSFVAENSAALLLEGLQRTNQFGVELVLTPPLASPAAGAAIVAIGRERSRENLVVGQRGDRLFLRMRVGSKRAVPYAETDLGPVDPGRRLRLALSYTPGRLTIHRDGELVERRRDLRGHFFQWRAYPLVLGDRAAGGADWAGTLESVAIWDRLLTPEEVLRNAELAARIRQSR